MYTNASKHTQLLNNSRPMLKARHPEILGDTVQNNVYTGKCDLLSQVYVKMPLLANVNFGTHVVQVILWSGSLMAEHIDSM